MPALRNRWWTPTTTCFGLLWVGLLCLAPRSMMGDPGTLWHTVAGERMLQTGELIRTDPFSFTSQGQPWVAQQWLAEIGMALLHRIGGLDALVLVAVTLLAATYAWLAGRFFRVGLPWPAVAVLMMLAVAASSYHFLPRPHIVTIALAAWTFALLVDVDAGRRNPRRLLLLPPLYVLWTNLHGGALGGIATSTLVLLAWLVFRVPGGAGAPTGNRRAPGLLPSSPGATRRFIASYVGHGGPTLPHVGHGGPTLPHVGHGGPMLPHVGHGGPTLPHVGHPPRRTSSGPTPLPAISPLLIGVVAGLSFVAVLVNPYGAALPRVWIGLMGSQVLPRLIIEHAPTRLASIEGAMILTLGGIYLALLVTTWRCQRRVTWLLPLVWLVLALTRIRHGPLFAVIAAVAIADMLPHCPHLFRLRLAHPSHGWNLSAVAEAVRSFDTRRPTPAAAGKLGSAATTPSHGRNSSAVAEAVRLFVNQRLSALIPAALVATALLLQANHVALPVIGSGWSHLSPDRSPIEAVEALRRRTANAAAPVRVFNDLGFGGYLIYAAPEARVYIDDRCELYRDDGLLQYERFTRNPELIDAFAAYEDVPYALTKSGSRFDRHFRGSPAWKLLHRDATASLYARQPVGHWTFLVGHWTFSSDPRPSFPFGSCRCLENRRRGTSPKR